MPLLDLLSLKYLLVRGENLKLASPFSLDYAPHELLSGGAGAAASIYRIYLDQGDSFKAKVTPQAQQVPSFISLIFKDNDGGHLAYARGLGSDSLKDIEFSLDAYAGKTGDFKLSSISITEQPVKSLLQDSRIENPARPIQQILQNDIGLFTNREALPEAFVVHSCRWLSDSPAILTALKKETWWDLEKEVILDRESPTAGLVRKTGEELQRRGVDLHKLKEPVKKIIDSPDRIAFSTYALQPGFLFLNHQYLPGWRAYVDGREWRIEKADYCFRAVFVDQGSHIVEFRYQPVGFEIGLYASLASLFSLFALGGTIFSRRFQKAR